jgi:hypothetical protein
MKRERKIYGCQASSAGRVRVLTSAIASCFGRTAIFPTIKKKILFENSIDWRLDGDEYSAPILKRTIDLVHLEAMMESC